jgi:hypothetical protein
MDGNGVAPCPAGFTYNPTTGQACTSDQRITVLYPNGSEAFLTSATIPVTFSTTLPVGTRYEISIVGKAYDAQVASGVVTATEKQSLTISIPSNVLPTNYTQGSYRIRVNSTDCSITCYQDQSDQDFTITSGAVLRPLSSEQILARLALVIKNRFFQQTGTALYDSNFDLDNSGTIVAADYSIIAGLSNLSAADFEAVKTKILNAVQSRFFQQQGTDRYIAELDVTGDSKILAEDYSAIKAALESTRGCAPGVVYNNLTGQPCPTTGQPSVTVLSPNGGEYWNLAQMMVNNFISTAVNWNIQNTTGTVNLDVDLLKGSNSVARFGTFNLTKNGPDSSTVLLTPGMPISSGSDYRIKLTLTSSSGTVLATDVSDNYFTVINDTSVPIPAHNVSVSNTSSTYTMINAGSQTPYSSTVTFRFTLSNNGTNDAYILRDIPKLVMYSSTAASASLSLLTSDSTSIADISSYYIIPSGTSRTFTLAGTMDNRGGSIGVKTLKINSITYYDRTFAQAVGINTGLENLVVAVNLDSGAVVVPASYNLSATASANGSISPSGTVTVAKGSSATFVMTPNPGYQVSNVIVDGVSMGYLTVYAFSNVTASHSIYVTFSQLPVVTPSVDTTAPTTPVSITSSIVSSSQINISWPASSDATGVVGYRVYKNGVQVGTTVGTSYALTGLSANTTYTITVAAYDAAGNASAQSTIKSVTTPAAPSVSPSASPSSQPAAASQGGYTLIDLVKGLFSN